MEDYYLLVTIVPQSYTYIIEIIRGTWQSDFRLWDFQ